jgi:putative Mn2+ efflux pump MntP
MGLTNIVLMSLGVSMDAAAISVIKGMSMCGMFRWKHALKMAAFFGLFQGIMPMMGYSLGSNFRELIQAWDHWIAFLLLAWIGISMLRESREEKTQGEPDFASAVLFPLAIATSIDALALGVSLAFLDANIIVSAGMMAGVTFAVCLMASWLGCRVQGRLANRAEAAGGIVLIFLGVKILAEHLFM